MIQSIIDYRVPFGTAVNQIQVWNPSTGLFEVSTSLSGLTLISPIISGDWTWLGSSELDCSDNLKIISIDPSSGLLFANGQTWLNLSTLNNKVTIGNTTDNPGLELDSTGLTTLGGNLLVNGGYIGDSDDNQLIEIDGFSGLVSVDGCLESVKSGVGTTCGANQVLNVLGADGVGSIGESVNIISGAGAPVAGLIAFNGGVFGLTSGDGGASSGLPFSVGGDGGRFFQVSGNGGRAYGTVGNNTGGNGGIFDLIGGLGGDADGVTAGTNTAGAGGSINILAGFGGDASNGSTNTGGNGADVNINPGQGGTGSTANGTDGNVYIASDRGNVRIGDSTKPTEQLEIKGYSRFGHSTSADYTEIEESGNVVFVGTAGLPFAEIYLHDESTAQSIATGATYTKFTGWTTNGQSNNCTSDAANDKITITKPGRYKIDGTLSGSSGTANVVFLGSVFWNGIEQNQIHWNRKFSTAGDVGSVSFNGIVDVTSVPTDIDLRLRHDAGAAVNFTANYGNIDAMQIGGT